MGELVIIPVFGREELLEQCLQAIRQTNPKVVIRLFIDRGYTSQKLLDLQTKYTAPGFTLPPHKKFGNTHCVLTALKWAAGMKASLVHYIESDVIVSPEYWGWSRRKHEDPDLFASSAWRNPAGIEQEMKITYFSGVGTCLKRSSVQWISQHVKHTAKEWDVAVAKLMARNAKFCAFPKDRLVTHAGYVGLNFNKRRSREDTGFVAMNVGSNRKFIRKGNRLKLVRY